MNRSFRLALLSLLVSLILPVAGAAAQDEPEKPAREEKPRIYDEQADAKKQIAEAVARARKESRRVLVQWGANWCGWCHLLHGTCKEDRDVARKLLYEYDVVLVDVGRFDRHMDLAASYGADLKSSGIPYLTILDGEGGAIANQETGALEVSDQSNPRHDPEKIIAVLTEHQAPYRSAESVLSTGLREAAAKNKKVFLHFGAPWCGWCHRLEDWMARKDVAEVLARDFVDVKIDVERTIGGKDVMARLRPEGSRGIPWFAILSADGRPVATSEGPDGNIGCPWKPDEIAQFREILGRVVSRVTADDIRRITSKLGKQ